MFRSMLESHKHGADLRELDPLTECVRACFDCASMCTMCADACLAEDMVTDLRYCIRTDLDCADICLATGKVAARQTLPSRDILHAQLSACLTACRVCAAECEQHAMHHDHCRMCAEACRQCERACEGLLAVIPQ